MVSRILEIRSSSTGSGAVSNLLLDALAQEWRQRGAEIRTRDLDAQPVPHVTSASLAGVLRGDQLDGEALEARRQSNEVIADVQWSDCLAIGAPMYNFGIGSALKAWFDHLMRPGAAFEYIDGVPTGLLSGKCAVICSARGNAYRGTVMNGFDCVEPHLRAMLAWVGITDITFIIAEGLALGEAARTAAIEAALGQAREFPGPRQTTFVA